MKKYSFILIIVFLLSFGVLMFFQKKLSVSHLFIQGTNNPIEVYVAKSMPQIYKGLGGKKSLDKDGMLFVFNKKDKHGIVMRDMHFAIDIIWLDHGEVIDIAKNIQPEPNVLPQDLKKYFPRNEVNLVLELPAGKADQYGIKIGTKIDLVK